MEAMKLTNDRSILAGNRDLPSDVRQSVVMLRFAEPIPRVFAYHFVRVRLSDQMFGDGEDGFFQASVIQPHRVAIRPCRSCDTERVRVGQTTQMCPNSSCPYCGVEVECGPLRGVVKVGLSPEFEAPDGRLDRLALILDRRYNEKTLANVYRTAGELCDIMGWRLT